MRFRRKRRAHYSWLPNYGQYVGATGNAYSDQQIVLDLTGTASSTPIGGCFPVVRDFPQNWDQGFMDPAGPLALESGLSEQIANEYFLKRIVGKITATTYFALSGPDNGVFGANLPPFKVTIGFFVARVDLNNINGPAGTATEIPELYSPQSFRAIREPWIWRRSWILGWRDLIQSGPGTSTGDVIAPEELGKTTVPWDPFLGLSFPMSNISYGSVLDGPHIDAKTARRVRQEERLFCSVWAKPWPSGTAWTVQSGQVTELFVDVDLRFLGSLRKSRNKSDFT